jgi:hypothetical protein
MKLDKKKNRIDFSSDYSNQAGKTLLPVDANQAENF